MSNFIPTGFYLKIEFLEIEGEQKVVHEKDVDKMFEAANVTGQLRDEQQAISAVVTFVDFCKKHGIKFDDIAGIVEDIYLGTNTVLANSSIMSTSSYEEAEEIVEKIKFYRNNGVKNEN